MKKYFLALAIFCNIAAVYAADEECEAAVDAASRVNPDKDKHCDYSNTGLNGVLHRALGKNSQVSKSEASESAAGEQKKVDTKTPSTIQATTTTTVNTTVKAPLASNEFASAEQLQTLRFALVQKTAQECSKGFVVEGERYVPTTKGMTLEFIYHCL